MNDPTLFDDAGLAVEPRFVDLRGLGALRSTLCNETQGTLYFDGGSVALSPQAWMLLRTILSLPQKG